MKKNQLKTLICILGLCGFGLVQAAPTTTTAQQPVGIQKQDVITTQMTVKAIDTKQRTLTLTDEAGVELIMHAGQQVRNFDQLKPGDKIRTRIVTSIAMSPAKKDSRITTETKELTLPVKGSTPGALYTTTVDTTVKVVSVTPKKSLVTVRTAKGEVEKLKVIDPELRQQLKSVKAGDNINVIINREVDITVTPKS